LFAADFEPRVSIHFSKDSIGLPHLNQHVEFLLALVAMDQLNQFGVLLFSFVGPTDGTAH
jgi:hypothetical protein